MREALVEALADAAAVVFDARDGRPIAGDVGRQATVNGIDAERKKLVESRFRGFEAERFAKEIPVEGFQVPEIKDQAVPLRDRAEVEGVRREKLEKGVGATAGLSEALEKGRVGVDRDFGGSQEFTSEGWARNPFTPRVPVKQ